MESNEEMTQENQEKIQREQVTQEPNALLSEIKRTRRYYKLTTAGNETSLAKLEEFGQFLRTMSKVLSMDIRVSV
ncbi:hypothetical protein FNH22_21945 [Fulvivirga sp. M361]|uniref:hypothetical protein n=1 Tax=Fulvivirga sp. M361 TaxID=2594266 RepID=UPI00117A330E|nr:hypothetical protein [Fulvivirga sp. M361]TRX52378.1 hypothetical protein FNH22_21945 [Fulvivirga sp. M361]